MVPDREIEPTARSIDKEGLPAARKDSTLLAPPAATPCCLLAPVTSTDPETKERRDAQCKQQFSQRELDPPREAAFSLACKRVGLSACARTC